MSYVEVDKYLEIEDIVERGDRQLEQAVSIVIPAFNEAQHVAEQIKAVQQVMGETQWRFEIIVVDDGSSDGTAQQASLTGVRVLRHKRNRGYGASLKRGIAASSFDWILITDADGTYPATSIPACSSMRRRMTW
jgi:glycosyltransferase involved in cell wall biosynthesis